MAFSYRWRDLITLVSKQVKNIPTQSVDALQCDWVSSRIAGRLPWKMQQQTIADGQIVLQDGVQDYDPPFNISRLTGASLRGLSVTPNEDITLTVRESLEVDFHQRSPYAMTSVALEAGYGTLRLTCAPIIASGEVWELRGTYQINPTKVRSTSQILWFDDRYVHVAIEGLTYVYYKLADDPRAGSTAGTWPGDISYTGQLAQFMSALKEVTDSEDLTGDMQVMPESALGISSSQYGGLLVGYGFGRGNGSGTTTGGIVSINSDATPAQLLRGGAGISVTDSGSGSHLISYIGSSSGGIVSINADASAVQQIVGSGAVTVTTSNGVTTIYVAPAATAQLSNFGMNPTSVLGGANSTGTVTLNMPAPAGGAVVTLSSSLPAVVSVPSSVTVPANSTSATFTATTTTVSSNTGATITAVYGVSKNATLTVNAPAPIYAGVGKPGATSSVTLSGNTVVLSTGDVLSQIKSTAEVEGDIWSFDPSNQVIYMLLFGGSHSFMDENTFQPFVCNAAIPVSLSGVAMYLYQSTNVLVGNYRPKVTG